MSTLTKNQIIEYLSRGELIINPCINKNGEFEVEPASYDLRAGMVIWKEHNPLTNENHLQCKRYEPEKPFEKQQTVELQPGQVVFVITYEEVDMPKNLCATVYAKNRFSREGILAFTTGHVDPGVRCPIVIRLINLRAIPFTIHLGEPIYTIVFNTMKVGINEKLESHAPISMERTIMATRESANAILANAFNDLSLTRDFVRKDEFDKLRNQTENLVKKDEFGKVFRKFLRKSFWGILLVIFAIIGAISAVIKIIEFFQ
jgi:deoxycytidine triphosphate deaminase